jgi:hypothetical protein
MLTQVGWLNPKGDAMDLIILNAILQAGRGRRAYGRRFTQHQIVVWAFARVATYGFRQGRRTGLDFVWVKPSELFTAYPET